MSGKSGGSSSAPPPPPSPMATPSNLSPETDAARRRQANISRQMLGYQSTMLTGPQGLGGSADIQKKELLGG